MTGAGHGDHAPLLAECAEVYGSPKKYHGTSNHSHDSMASDSECGADEVQDGLREMEAVNRSWTRWGLVIAYMSILLMAFTTSLEGQVTYPLAAFAVSSFKKHSLLSTVYVVQNVVNAVIKPPMAKIADVFGRLEAFTISITLLLLGYLLMATSQNVQTYASAQIFYSAGGTGLQILQQVFIADTSSFINRALFSSLPETPFLVTVWIGPAIASAILAHSTWRWGYGMWVFILPLAFFPLAISLHLNSRKATRLGLLKPKHHASTSTSMTLKRLSNSLDIPGTLLLSAGLSLVLLPLTLASRAPQGWSSPAILASITLGLGLLVLFPLWESRAPHPLLPLPLLRSRTFSSSCALAFLWFTIFYIAVQPYFYSYLLVALNLPISLAGPITQTFSFASTLSALSASLLLRRSKSATPRPRPFILTGAALYTLAVAVLLHTRTRTASVPILFAAQATLGAGAGLMHVATQLAVQVACDKAHVGVATAAFLTVAEVGAALGSALSGAIWGRLVPGRLVAYLPEGSKGEAARIYASVVVACSFPWGGPEREAIARAYQEVVTVLLWVALGVCVPLMGGGGGGGGETVVEEVIVVNGGERDAVVVVMEDEGRGWLSRVRGWGRQRGRGEAVEETGVMERLLR